MLRHNRGVKATECGPGVLQVTWYRPHDDSFGGGAVAVTNDALEREVEDALSALLCG